MASPTSALLDRIPADTENGVDRSTSRGATGPADEADAPPAVAARLAGRDVSRLDDEAALTIAATTLAGADDLPAELASYGPVPAAIARRIAADPTGTWRRLVTDPINGTLLDFGRRTYRPPVALADHVRARDATCRFPPATTARGTPTSTTRCPYPQGPTAAGNRTALCRTHHRPKHQSQWTVTQHGGRVTWRSPTGRTYTRHPEPHGPPSSPSNSVIAGVQVRRQ